MSYYLVVFFFIAMNISAQPSTISVEELRNPVKGKSLHALRAAREHLINGQLERSIWELRQAMSDPVATPYAISLLGVAHLRQGQVDLAVSELEQAVRLLPGRAENHINLAFALYLKGQTERGLLQARKALQLDGGRPQTRLVLGVLLLQQGSHDAEAVQQLRAAAEAVPTAHLELAEHYDQAGQAREAEKERRAYAATSMGFLAAK